jgi:hypothetical protein
MHGPYVHFVKSPPAQERHGSHRSPPGPPTPLTGPDRIHGPARPQPRKGPLGAELQRLEVGPGMAHAHNNYRCVYRPNYSGDVEQPGSPSVAEARLLPRSMRGQVASSTRTTATRPSKRCPVSTNASIRDPPAVVEARRLAADAQLQAQVFGTRGRAGRPFSEATDDCPAEHPFTFTGGILHQVSAKSAAIRTQRSTIIPACC